MMQKIKKPVSILLSLIMIISLFTIVPFTASAATYVASVTSGGTTTEYTDFAEALNAWATNTTLTLLDNVTSGRIIVDASKTLDLNGKTITFNNDNAESRVIHVGNSGTVLTLKDSSGNNSGKLTGINTPSNDWSGALYINTGATVNMYGGTISGNTSYCGAGVWIDGRGTRGNATFNMYGGLITGNTATIGGGVYVGRQNNDYAGTAHFNMYGGTITGNEATTGRNVYVDHGIMTHTGGTINAGFSHDGYVIVFFNKNDGTGTMSAQYVKKNTATQIKANENYDNNGAKTAPAFTREGHTFAGWNTEQDGNGIDFIAGVDSINITENTTLYAKWTPNKYTVTWKNGDTVLETDENVPYGTTPTYDGATPTKADGECCTFTFAGWNDGTATYTPDAVPAVNGDVTYTAVFTDAPKDGYYKATADGHSVYSIVPLGENIDRGETRPYFFTDGDNELFSLTSLKNCKYYYYDANGNDLSASFTKSFDGTYSTAVTSKPMPKIVLVKPVYTITWNNWDDSALSVMGTDVIHGETPVYEGTEPTKEADAQYTYTFAGWTPALAPATDNATYKATFTEAPKTLIAGHSISLAGDIGINFYLDPSVAGMTVADVRESNLSYTFAWADGVNAKVNVAGQSGSAFKRVNKDGKDYIMVTCKVCAAEMSCGVKASFTLGGEPEGETYSVRDYCDTILKTSNDALLIDLATKMLQYGAKAQTVFSINTSDPADSIVPATTDPVPADVTDEMIDKAIAEETENGGAKADDMNTVASGLGAKWYATTLIYLSENTLRHYFIKDTDTFNPSDYTASKSDYYYYVQVTDIPAAKLDKLQTFTAGNKTFKYSALDCVKGVLHSSASDDSKNLAKALYWYNKAANAYFRL